MHILMGTAYPHGYCIYFIQGATFSDEESLRNEVVNKKVMGCVITDTFNIFILRKKNIESYVTEI